MGAAGALLLVGKLRLLLIAKPNFVPSDRREGGGARFDHSTEDGNFLWEMLFQDDELQGFAGCVATRGVNVYIIRLMHLPP